MSHENTATPELNVLALCKGEEKYVYIYDDSSSDQIIAQIRNQAASPEYSCSWFDAAVLEDNVREQIESAVQDLQPRQRLT